MVSKFGDISRFLQRDLWNLRLADLPPTRAAALRALRIAAIVGRRFTRDQCHLRASALTLFTLLSIVPMLAMAFGIAKGFGLQDAIERETLRRLAGQEEVARWIMDFAHTLLETTRGGLIAGIGVVALFWTVLKVLQNIEISLNAIWKIDRHRPFSRRVSDYLSFMLIAPVLLVVSSGLTVMVTQQVGFMSERFGIVSYFESFILKVLHLVPYLVLWALFTFLYIFMPNTKVKATSAALGGVLAGTLYQIFQAAYIYFQVGMSNYNAVYGSFAALPLFLVWLQASWMIVLLGAEICYAHQNTALFECEPQIRRLNRAARNLAALSVMRYLARRFHEGERGCSEEDLVRAEGMPVLLIRQTLTELEKSGLVARMAPPEDNGGSSVSHEERLYQPAVPVAQLTICRVLDHLEQNGESRVPVLNPAEIEDLAQRLKALHEAAEKSPANSRLLDL
jgi:membrane protein